MITSGEPVPLSLRRELRELFAAVGASSVEIRARYAFTEMQGGMIQCAENAQPQNVCPDLYYLEVVDPDTGRSLSDGESGMLAITHLHRRGTVLLRYLVGDIVTLSRASCPVCGQQGESLVGAPRRVGKLVKCRGMLVNTDVVLDVVSTMSAIGEFQIVFTRDQAPGAMDQMVIRIERGRNGEETREASIREAIVEQRVRAAVLLRPLVEFVPHRELYNHEQSIKSKRVVDLRG